jgi:hypothetical protein
VRQKLVEVTMGAKLILHGVMTSILLILGGSLTIFPEQIREYCFRQYKASAERVGFFASMVDRYPSSFVFRLTGIVVLGISIFLIVVFVKNFRN